MISLSKVHKLSDYCSKENVFIINNNYFEENISCRVKSDPSSVSPEEQAEKIIKNAKDEANRILTKAKIDSAALKNKVKEEAYYEGFEIGKKEGYEELKQKLNDTENILLEMQEQKYQLIKDMEDEILNFSIFIAKKIIGKQIKEDKSAFLSLISNAVKSAYDAEKVTVYLNSEQYENVKEYKQILLRKVKEIKSLELICAELEDKFGCIIETDYEQIDAGVDSQINEIKNAFKLTESFA